MRALCWIGVNDLRVETVPDPEIVNPHDAILKVRLTTTCGSDLHFIDGYIPTMREGDVIGHEFMGEVVEVGPEASKVKQGDRVVVPSFIGCGKCWYCEHDLYSLCDNTHPKPELQEPMLGYPTAGIYGYTPRVRRLRRLARASTSASRTPTSTASRCPRASPDEQALFLSDAAPDRLHGRRLLRHPAGRHRRRLGLRRRRADGAAERPAAGRRARDRASTACPSGWRWPASISAPRRSTTPQSTASSRR